MNLFEFDISKTTLEVKTAFAYSPKILNYSNKNTRQYSGFLYIVHGMYRYSFEGGSFLAGDNSLVYLPPKSKPYSYEILTDNCQELQSMQIEIDILDCDTKKPVAFSEHPVLITQSVSSRMGEVYGDIILTKSKTDITSKFTLYSELYKLLAMFSKSVNDTADVSVNYKKIEPALYYIQENYKADFSGKYLAQLCNVSETHLRRIFKTELGKSPLKYKNELLLQEACTLLKRVELTIGEIADILGFNDIYTFSHFFKKEKGISPAHYRSEKCK